MSSTLASIRRRRISTSVRWLVNVPVSDDAAMDCEKHPIMPLIYENFPLSEKPVRPEA
jgi:hypothetical protein